VEWESFLATTLASLRPEGDDERMLAVCIAEHRWRIRRLARVETALLEQRMKAVSEADPSISDGDAALAQLFIDPAEQKRLSLLLRYTTAAERSCRQAMQALEILQQARREAETFRHIYQADAHNTPVESLRPGIGRVPASDAKRPPVTRLHECMSVLTCAVAADASPCKS
jgi:hypothetical protein